MDFPRTSCSSIGNILHGSKLGNFRFKYTDNDFQMWFDASPSPPPQKKIMVEGRTVRSSTCTKNKVEGMIFDFYF